MFPSLNPRFWANVEKTDSCWLWRGPKYVNGYGMWNPKHNKRFRAHRAAYANLVGVIPTGLYVCHRCDNRLCINPAHLFVGTHMDNTRDCMSKGRTANGKKTHCIYGHEFTPENTRTVRGKYRECRACSRRTSNAYNKKRRGHVYP